jgi:hypothetical protein
MPPSTIFQLYHGGIYLNEKYIVIDKISIIALYRIKNNTWHTFKAKK